MPAVLLCHRAAARRSRHRPQYRRCAGSHMLVVGEGDKVEQREVVVDRGYRQQWVVKDGVKAGERVIMEGVQKVKPGMVVRAISQQEAERAREAAAKK